MTSTTRRTIAVVEPQMEDLFHAPFNAALLHAVALAYPESPLSFRAFPGHIRVVRSIFEQHAPELLPKIEWVALSLPSGGSLPARYLQSRSLVRQLTSSAERILFSSISRMQLLHLKNYLQRKSSPQVNVVFHGDIDRLGEGAKESFPKSLFSLERVLLKPHPPALRYQFLSQSIRSHIPPQFQQAVASSSFIDHPYHFPPLEPVQPSELVFGVFGNTGDGRLLEQVAQQVKAATPSVRFRLVGFLANQQAVERLRPLVEDVTDKPISRETFLDRAQGISHALWLSPPNSFRLRASGTFFDALAYGKPLIYTANPFIDPYFTLDPRIGTRCESLEEVAPAILKLVKSYDAPGYTHSREAIGLLRSRFTPEALAERLPAALRWN